MLHPIGAGALGPVFRVYDPRRDAFVALKILRLDLPPDRVHKLASELEALVAADLRHPALATPLAAGIVEASAYLAQDLVTPADSLDVFVRERGPMPPPQAVGLATELAAALDHAFAKNVVHGGIHPRDILVSSKGTRLTGIGLVRALEHVNVSAPNRRPYVAPERAAGAQWDRRADIFSLAATVFELLWGRRLIGIGEHAVRGLKPLEGANLMALQRVLGRALAGDPAGRFETAQAFAEALQAAFETHKAASEGAMVPPRPEATASSGSAHAAPPVVPSIRAGKEERRSRNELKPSLPLDDIPFSSETPGPSAHSVDRESSVDNSPRLNELELARIFAPVGQTLTALEDLKRPTAAASSQAPGDNRLDALRLEPARDQVDTSQDSARARGPIVLAAPPAVTSRPGPPLTLPAPPPVAPSTFLSSTERMPSTIWPLAVALVIGLAVGFAGGYGAGSRETSDKSALAVPGTEAGAESSGVGSRNTSALAVPGITEAGAESSGVGSRNTIEVPSANQGKSGASGSDVAQSTASSAPDRLPAPPPSRSDAAAPAASGGHVLVRSTPPGARAWVDGREAGVTPITLRDLAPGSHTVRLSLAGYGTRERRVVVGARRSPQTIAIELAAVRSPTPRSEQKAAGSVESAGRSTGGLEVVSRPPGANVFVDGKLVGTTPLVLQSIAAGEHGIRLEQEGYRSWVSAVRIGRGERSRVAASLEP